VTISGIQVKEGGNLGLRVFRADVSFDYIVVYATERN
jgi:hypothetical protein